MATTHDGYYIYCYNFHGLFWFGWIMTKKLHNTPLYFDDTPTTIMFPESWIDYVTFGLSQTSVFNKLRKRYERLKDIHSKH